MKFRTLVTLFSFSMAAVAFTPFGCGDDKKTEEISENTNTSSGNIVQDFKDGMIELSKQIIEVTENVETVEDAEAAEPKIEKAMNSIVGLFTGLADNVDKITSEELKELESMKNIDEDPEVKEWMQKAEAAMDKLKEDHPEAAAKLEELGEKHIQEMMGAMMKIGQNLGMGR